MHAAVSSSLTRKRGIRRFRHSGWTSQIPWIALTKEFERDIDDQGRFLLAKFRIVGTGAIVCMSRYFGQSATCTIKLTHVFLVAGWWVRYTAESPFGGV